MALAVDPRELQHALEHLLKQQALDVSLTSPSCPGGAADRWTTWDLESPETDGHDLIDLDEFMARVDPDYVDSSERQWPCLDVACPDTTSAMQHSDVPMDHPGSARMLESGAEHLDGEVDEDFQEGEEEASVQSDVWTWADLELSCQELDETGEGKIVSIDLTHLVLESEMRMMSLAQDDVIRVPVGRTLQPRSACGEWSQSPQCVTLSSTPGQCPSPGIVTITKCRSTSRTRRPSLLH